MPCSLHEDYEALYGQVFTNHIDSPNGLICILESREYSISSGRSVKPGIPVPRKRGTITVDNENYLRYKIYIHVIDLIGRGMRFVFTQ